MGDFKSIAEDHLSGSVKILEHLIDAIREEPFKVDSIKLMKEIGRVCVAHSNLFVLKKFSDQFNELLGQKPSPEDVGNWLDDYEEKWRKVNRQLAETLIGKYDFNNASILLHSSSKTIIDAIAIMMESGMNLTIFQTESRPMYEGREQALILSGLKCKVILITDAAIGAVMPETDVILLGADQFDDSSFVNKIGTFGICLAARQFGKPVFVLADERKKVNEVTVKNHYPETEIWDSAPKNIEVRNLYFEKISRKLIDDLIS